MQDFEKAEIEKVKEILAYVRKMTRGVEIPKHIDDAVKILTRLTKSEE